ncbi:MAG: T9SS type A sorting domain-containing protein, partial [Saprospiraceae bacterium]
KLAAWPNPTSGQIQFGILKDEEAYTPDESLLVEVLDINMTVVSSAILDKTSTSSLTLPQVPAGEYYLRTQLKGQTVISTKIVKQ